MKATCQSCQGYAPDKCAKGYPFWGSAHICVKGFEPREFLRNGKLNGITIDHFDSTTPETFRSVRKWVC